MRPLDNVNPMKIIVETIVLTVCELRYDEFVLSADGMRINLT